MKKNHAKKPSILGQLTNLFPVYSPNILLIEIENLHENFENKEMLVAEFFNKEFLEMYFSNRKRSGGDSSIRSMLVETAKNKAYILFENSESKFLLFILFLFQIFQKKKKRKIRSNKTDFKLDFWY